MVISGELITEVIKKFKEDYASCSSSGSITTVEGSLSEVLYTKGLEVSSEHFSMLLERLEKELLY